MAYTTIDKPSDYFNTKLYTGNGNTDHAITGVGFQTDFFWGKKRSATGSNFLVNSISGVGKHLISDDTGAETTFAEGVKSFDSDGVTIGTAGDINDNSQTFVAWNWKAGTSVSGTTTGSGTGKAYSGSVSTTSGFSIIKYLGNGTAGHTIPHHLGAVPKFIIVKQTIGGDENWFNYHVSLGNTKDIHLNQTNAAATADSWNDTTPTSSVFSISDQSAVNGNGNTHVAYCFSEKKGYSKFGSYTGNGNANGAFVYTGFKPAFVITKNTTSSGYNWVLFDNKRSTSGFNVVDKRLEPDTNNAEGTTSAYDVDLVSNGFKSRGTGSGVNRSGNTFIYMAFAEQPFVSSSGVPATAR